MTDPNVTVVPPITPAEPEVPEKYKGKTFADMVKIAEDNRKWSESKVEEAAKSRADKLADERAEQKASQIKQTVASLTSELAANGTLSADSQVKAKELGLEQFISTFSTQMSKADKHAQEQIVYRLATKLEVPQDLVTRVFAHIDSELASDPKTKELVQKQLAEGKTGLFQDYLNDYVNIQTAKPVMGSFNAPVMTDGFKDIQELVAAQRGCKSEYDHKQLEKRIEATPWYARYEQDKMRELDKADMQRKLGRQS